MIVLTDKGGAARISGLRSQATHVPPGESIRLHSFGSLRKAKTSKCADSPAQMAVPGRLSRGGLPACLAGPARPGPVWLRKLVATNRLAGCSPRHPTAPMLLEDTARNRRIGIALVSLSTLCFAGLDACAKWLIQTLPVVEVVWLRFVLHALITPVLLGPLHGRDLFGVRRPGLHLFMIFGP